ncbi:MAG: MarR family transcriptional regulator [Bacteroides sp.]
MKRNDSPMPLFETDEQNGHFLATMPIHRAFIDEKAYLASIGKELDANEQYNDKKDDKIKLSDLQEHILILIKGNDKITIPELARKARTSESSISRALREE